MKKKNANTGNGKQLLTGGRTGSRVFPFQRVCGEWRVQGRGGFVTPLLFLVWAQNKEKIHRRQELQTGCGDGTGLLAGQELPCITVHILPANQEPQQNSFGHRSYYVFLKKLPRAHFSPHIATLQVTCEIFMFIKWRFLLPINV